jgi:hypothetical protein
VLALIIFVMGDLLTCQYCGATGREAGAVTASATAHTCWPQQRAPQARRSPLKWVVATWLLVGLAGAVGAVALVDTAFALTFFVAPDANEELWQTLPLDLITALYWLTLAGHVGAYMFWRSVTTDLVDRYGGGRGIGRHWFVLVWGGAMVVSLLIHVTATDVGSETFRLVASVLLILLRAVGAGFLIAGVLLVRRKVRRFLAEPLPTGEGEWKVGGSGPEIVWGPSLLP